MVDSAVRSATNDEAMREPTTHNEPRAANGRRRVVIIGGGFGGLTAARALRKVDVDITLIDRRNFHLFQPLLYQVATGGLSPANIAAPLRSILSRQRNCQVMLANVTGFDLVRRMVQLDVGQLSYDLLIVAAGATHSYFGHDEWARFAPGLKTIEDATEIRARVLTAFEAAEREGDDKRRREWLRFVIVGGGPTGVELAGALAEISQHTLRADFRAINPAEAQVVLIEAGPRLLAAFPPDLSDRALASLQRLGVEVRLGALVTDVNAQGVTLKSPAGANEWLAARTVLWGAGVQASPLAQLLADAAQCTLDRAGRIKVQPDFSLPGYPEVFCIGDMAHYSQPGGQPLPGVAPAAMQAAEFVAGLIRSDTQGQPRGQFAYRNLGNLATIGRSHAVAELGRWHFGGWLAWMLWLFVHLMQIVSFRNRLLVLLQWAWSYFTYDRSARLITGRTEAAVNSPIASAETGSPAVGSGR